jgi:hypothetical protein
MRQSLEQRASVMLRWGRALQPAVPGFMERRQLDEFGLRGGIILPQTPTSDTLAG